MLEKVPCKPHLNSRWLPAIKLPRSGEYSSLSVSKHRAHKSILAFEDVSLLLG